MNITAMPVVVMRKCRVLRQIFFVMINIVLSVSVCVCRKMLPPPTKFAFHFVQIVLVSWCVMEVYTLTD